MAQEQPGMIRYDLGTAFFTKSGFYDPRIITHGYKRYRTRNAQWGFPNIKTPVPYYWVHKWPSSI